MEGLATIDVVVAAIVAIALLRGFFLGLIREVFSLAAIGGACVSVRLWGPRAAAWLEAASAGRIGPLVAPWLGGAMLAVASIAVVVLAGRVLRRGARWAGLGLADRAGGALLGTAEGALVVGIALAVAGTLLGRDHPTLANSRSLAALESLERLAQQGGAPEIDVAAPPPRSR